MKPVDYPTPIDGLIREHRIIESMCKVVEKQMRAIHEGERIALHFFEVVVDFFKTYGDSTHHGKEVILFSKVATKKLSPEHKMILDELVKEHILLRQLTANLAIANEKYLAGAIFSHQAIVDCIQQLLDLQLPHMEKEEKHFFYQCLKYLTQEEQSLVLREFWEFDRLMIHEKYRQAVKRLEAESL